METAAKSGPRTSCLVFFLVQKEGNLWLLILWRFDHLPSRRPKARVGSLSLVPPCDLQYCPPPATSQQDPVVEGEVMLPPCTTARFASSEGTWLARADPGPPRHCDISFHPPGVPSPAAGACLLPSVPNTDGKARPRCKKLCRASAPRRRLHLHLLMAMAAGPPAGAANCGADEGRAGWWLQR